MARQTPGNYVPLDVNYARDIAIRRAGPTAELLFLRSLAYAKGARTSGFVSDFDLEVVAVGMRAVKAAAETLVICGLWVRVTDGWLIRSWERWNASDKVVSAGGKLGNHKRWHLDRGESDPACELCADAPPIAPRSHPDSPPISPPESQGKGREVKNYLSSELDETVDPFDEFWRHYPRKEAKAAARKAWTKAISDADTGDIIDGLTAYAFSPDPKYRPLPASWLNGKRWEDERALRLVKDDPHAGKTRHIEIFPGQWREVGQDEVVMGRKVEWR